MPTSLFILSRFTLRVDNVLFRTQDTRLYHSLVSNPPLMVRDISGWEAPYEHVQRVRFFAILYGSDINLYSSISQNATI